MPTNYALSEGNGGATKSKCLDPLISRRNLQGTTEMASGLLGEALLTNTHPVPCICKIGL